jgi:hypothetical protein
MAASHMLLRRSRSVLALVLIFVFSCLHAGCQTSVYPDPAIEVKLECEEVGVVSGLQLLASDHEHVRCFVPSGEAFVTNDDYGWLRVRSLDGNSLLLLEGGRGRPAPFPKMDPMLDISRDGHFMVTLDRGDGMVFVWDLRSGERVSAVYVPETDRVITAVAISPDGKYMLTGCEFEVLLWDVRTGNFVRKMAGRLRGTIRQVSFSPDGKRCGSMDGGLVIWDVATGEVVRKMGSVDCAEFLAVGERWFAVTNHRPVLFGLDETLVVDLDSGQFLPHLTVGRTVCWIAGATMDGKYWVGYYEECKGFIWCRGGRFPGRGFIRLYEIDTGRLVAKAPLPWGTVMDVLSPDGRYFTTRQCESPLDKDGYSDLWSAGPIRLWRIVRKEAGASAPQTRPSTQPAARFPPGARP